MKLLIILLTVLGLCFADYYSDTYDNFDVNKYNELEYIRAAIDCIMDDGKCDPEHEFFKQNVQDIFNNACARCSPAYKHIVRGYIENGRRQCPYRMMRFFQRFDPTKTLRQPLWDSVKDA
uniref:Chemosensory protein n=1 Tax=Histia rhodope TaxID=1453155 RepID=A0A6M9BLX8_9NEOP|nr:chemosensory protein [Histia rhodope]